MKIKLFLFFVFFCISDIVIGQVTTDAGLWATFNVDKKLSKKISLFLTEEYRLKENFTQTNLFYTDFGAELRPAKFLKIALAYRLIEKKLIDNSYGFRHRIMVDITLKKKLGNLAVSYRHRLQSEVRNIYTSNAGKMPEWYSRNKIKVQYDFKKPLKPYFAAEFRYQFHDPRNVESDKTWHRNRCFIGLDYEHNNKNTFGLYYLLQQEFNVSTPQNLFIIGLEYSLSLY